jgi:hypothetical protein
MLAVRWLAVAFIVALNVEFVFAASAILSYCISKEKNTQKALFWFAPCAVDNLNSRNKLRAFRNIVRRL